MKRLLIIIFGILVSTIIVLKVVNLKKSKSIPATSINRNSIRLDIINCSGIDKAGNLTQDFLRDCGFDVYEVRSGIRLIDKTTIVERVHPDLKNAKEVRAAMSITKKQKIFFIPLLSKKIYPEIQKDIDSTLYLEATIILGKDCEIFLSRYMNAH